VPQIKERIKMETMIKFEGLKILQRKKSSEAEITLQIKILIFTKLKYSKKREFDLKNEFFL